MIKNRKIKLQKKGRKKKGKTVFILLLRSRSSEWRGRGRDWAGIEITCASPSAAVPKMQPNDSSLVKLFHQRF